MYSDITGIILSGGKSTRMGVNKSLLIIDGKTIIARVRDLMLSLFSKVMLITNEPEANYRAGVAPRPGLIFLYFRGFNGTAVRCLNLHELGSVQKS